MKAVKKLAVLSMGLLVPLAALAATAEEAYLATANNEPGAPVPVKVVAPSGYTAEPGDTVELVFVVNASGLPTDIAVKSSTEKSLADAAVSAVKQWRFTPPSRNGEPVATKVLLPVHVTRAGPMGTRIARY